MTKSSAFLEYIKLHRISLIQDNANLIQDLYDAKNGVDIPDEEYFGADTYYEGAINTIDHLLSVATDIMNSTNERYNNDNI